MLKLLSLLTLLLALTGYSQESILKDFAEDRRDYKLALYPSTLRMINIQKDPNFDELVSDIEKLLIYTLDSATSASGSYTDFIDEYRERDFEEYITMTGTVNLIILGKDEEYVGVTGSNDQAAAFYLKGAIALHKIPELIQTFEQGDILSILSDQLDR